MGYNKRTRRKRRTKTRKHFQKLYKMKGCSKKRRQRNRRGGMKPIGGFEIRGGNSYSGNSYGGNSYGGNSYGGNSSPFVGKPYTIDNGGNYYGLQNNFSVDRDYKLRGGTIVPSNLLNVGRQMSYGFESIINGVGGYEAPTDPTPYVQTKI